MVAGFIVRETLRALLALKRALVLATVAVAMAAVEAWLGIEPWGPPHTLLLVLTFALVAPATYRHFVRPGSPLGIVIYLVVGLAAHGAVSVILPAAVGMQPTLFTDEAGASIGLLLFWIGGWGLGRDIELERALARERELRDHAQLLARQAHLDPHFLFNTLNAIAEWCQQDPREAEEALLRLATMLRVVLDGIEVDRWPLRREVELVDDLWHLHLARDPDRFTIEVHVDDAAAGCDVPPLLLLPIAENAMTHGVWRGARGPVRLRGYVEADVLRVDVESPGAYGGPREGSRGLDAVRRRLAWGYGPDAQLEVGEVEETRTRAQVVLPLERVQREDVTT